jgi:hypothetical protein
VNGFLTRDKEDLVEVITNSQENARLQVPRGFLLGLATIQDMEEGKKGYRTMFVT